MKKVLAPTDYAEIVQGTLWLVRQNHQDLTPDDRQKLRRDTERDHYMLVSTGWDQQRRIRGTTVYVRLRDNKLWIEEDWLEHGITPDLLAAGVPKEDIVLAFHPPEMRALTGFAATQ